MQRNRVKTNESRIIDLDLLMYGDEIIESKKLVIPHPRMHERLFVLIPLKDIDKNIVIPNQGAIKDIINKLAPENINRIK